MPAVREAANTWNVAVMELGALVCVARGPRCEQCPVVDLCAWNLAGRPAHDGPARKGQAWHGTDRQVRGELLRRLRERHAAVALADLEDSGPDLAQVMRCLDSLVVDGLVQPLSGKRFRLPA
jgi:A/G-specific adenine glycosylase